MDLARELEVAKKLAIEAGNEIINFYNAEKFDSTTKKDNTPLTKADLAANKIIIQGLKRAFSEYGFLSEEEKDNQLRLTKKKVWIVDPLDGTKEFISKNGQFTVNIALSNNRIPVLGVIYVPVTKELYFASKDQGAYYANDKVEKLKVSETSNIQEMVVVKSRFHATEKSERFIEMNNFRGVKSVGSSLKGILIAKGEADVYIRFGEISEWDICAMHCILNEAGGILTDLEGQEVKYNSKKVTRSGILASNNKIHKNLINSVKNLN